jgi:hypothetical protein
MTRFVDGDDRSQSTLFHERLDDHLGSDNPVRAIDVLVDGRDLAKLGFDGVEPEATVGPNGRTQIKQLPTRKLLLHSRRRQARSIYR